MALKLQTVIVSTRPGRQGPAIAQWFALIGKPFAVGLVLLELILAVAGYLLVIAAWRARARCMRSSQIAYGSAASAGPGGVVPAGAGELRSRPLTIPHVCCPTLWRRRMSR